ncbi:hypothetical protein TRVL_10342 [Trypanosoma vivax]|nr:hypothetical protein TRVL_10342 [Trypanosoma vivax]
MNTTRHCETNGMCAAVSGGERRKEGRWYEHGQTEQAARHVLARRVQRAREWRRAQQSNDDLCNAQRTHHKRFAQQLHSNNQQVRHETSVSQCTQRSYQCRHTLHKRASA